MASDAWKIKMFKHTNRWTWVLLNGDVVASGGRYKTESECRHAIEITRTKIVSAIVTVLENKS